MIAVVVAVGLGSLDTRCDHVFMCRVFLLKLMQMKLSVVMIMTWMVALNLLLVPANGDGTAPFVQNVFCFWTTIDVFFLHVHQQ